jgi:hypothetical protein
MTAVAVDTHAIVWYLSLELTYLIEKGRVPAAARQKLINAIDDPATPGAENRDGSVFETRPMEGQ